MTRVEMWRNALINAGVGLIGAGVLAAMLEWDIWGAYFAVVLVLGVGFVRWIK